MDVFKDERFKHIVKDPKFRNVPRKDRKVKIDKRFESMFTDEKFKLKYSVDQRGRPIKHSQVEDLKKYYELSDDSDQGSSTDEKPTNKTQKKSKQKLPVKTPSDSEDELSNERSSEVVNEDSNLLDTNDEERSKLTYKVLERLKDISVDYARGEGILATDSSSSDEATTEDSEEEIEHDWGELDKDAEETDEATERLAVCNLDWDRVRATDIMVLLHSFLPPTGFIKSVTIYPSEFGLERMKEEEMKGPQELTEKRVEEEDENSDEDEEFHREKLREYQMKRLRYFYAVVVFDCVDSANKVYSECDRMEYESSATKLDLRFIPDDMTFDQEPRECCTSLPVAGNYKPRLFANSALQQEKVELTWDETDPSRLDLSRRLAQGAAVSEADLKTFIATSSEEENGSHASSEEDEDEGNERPEKKDKEEESKGDDISKYRSLLAGIRRDEERKNKGKVEMEISWDLALENRTREVEEENNSKSLTPFQKMIKNRQEMKKKQSKKDSDSDNLISDDDLPSDIDVNDPFFNDELGGKNTKKKKKKKGDWNVQDKSDDEGEKRKAAELELLLADGEEEAGKKHFSLKAIQEREANQNKKGKKSKNAKNNLPEDDFKIDLKDDRFGALFTSHLYNVDPADSHFRRTKAMDDIIAEKSKRRKQNFDSNESTSSKKLKSDGPQLSLEVNKLLSSVKKKATKLNNK